MRPIDRRTFVQGLAVASAATAAPLVLSDRDRTTSGIAGAGAPLAPRWSKAPCRLCGVGCGLLVGVQNGRAVGAKGDPASPVAQGLGCIKGYHSLQGLYGRDRITRALVRRNGALVPVPLAEALDLVARRLRETIDQHGKDSVGLYGSAQWPIVDAYVASKLFKGALGTNNVDTSARLHAGSAIAGLESSLGLDGSIGCYEDIDHADVFVLWDINLAESDPVLFSRMLERRRQNPAVRIIDLATRTTRTSYAADQSVLHTPHSALVIGNAICRELVARKLVRQEFVDRYVSFKSGQTEFGGASPDELVRDEPTDVSWSAYVDFLNSYGPDHAQRLSGVPAATVRWIASLYGDPTRRVMSLWGTNLNADGRGTWTNNVLYNIHLLTGKIASPGNGPFCMTGQPNGGSAVHDAGSLARSLPRGNVESSEDRRRAAEIWGVPVERIDTRPGRPALAMFRALEGGEVRFLWIQATNPMLSLPNLDRYRRAAGRQDRFVVVSEAYPTPTTDVADVVLPAAMGIEREGVYANMERRVQYLPRLVAPPGDAASDAWHMIEVARRLGFVDLFPWDRARHVEQIWREYSRFHPDPDSALPPIEVLRSQAGALWPFVEGRETKWRYNPEHDPAADAARGAFDFYGHADHRAWIWLRPAQPPAEAPDDAYPFWLVTGPVLEHWGGGALTRRIATLRRGLPHAYIEINREDAAANRIRDREIVRLVSRRGAIEAEARIDYRSQPPRGQVFVPVFDEGVPINRLTGDSTCPLSGQPDGHKCAVRVERIGARRPS